MMVIHFALDAPVRVPAQRARVTVKMVVSIHHVSQPDLVQVTHALGLLGFSFCARQRRQEHGCKDGNNGDNYQKFD